MCVCVCVCELSLYVEKKVEIVLFQGVMFLVIHIPDKLFKK